MLCRNLGYLIMKLIMWLNVLITAKAWRFELIPDRRQANTRKMCSRMDMQTHTSHPP